MNKKKPLPNRAGAINNKLSKAKMKKFIERVTMRMPKSYREFSLDYMKQWVNEQVKGESLLEMYAPFWLTVGVIGGPLLAVLGGVFDGLVVYAITFGISGSKILAWTLAITLSLLIQLFLGISVILTVISCVTENFNKKGYRLLTAMTFIVGVGALGFTLYLATQSENVVKVVHKTPTLIDTDSISRRMKFEQRTIQNNYKERKAEIRAEYADLISLKKSEIKEYEKAQRLVIRNKRRNNELTRANRIEQNLLTYKAEQEGEIGRLTRERYERIEQLEADKIASVAQSDTLFRSHIATAVVENNSSETAFSASVAYWGNAVIWLNFIINLLRAVILVFIHKWANGVRREIKQADNNRRRQAQTIQPGQPVYISNPPRGGQAQTLSAHTPKGGQRKSDRRPEQTGGQPRIITKPDTRVYVHTDSKNNPVNYTEKGCAREARRFSGRLKESLNAKKSNWNARENRAKWLLYWMRAAATLNEDFSKDLEKLDWMPVKSAIENKNFKAVRNAVEPFQELLYTYYPA